MAPRTTILLAGLLGLMYQVAASPAQRRADASDAKGCGAQVALALMEWLQTWSDNPDYQTVWLHNTLNHFANTLFVDIHDFDEMQNFACKLTVAADAGEIQDVLQVNDDVMTIVKTWAYNDFLMFNDAQTAEKWLGTMHKQDTALRQLGYPTLPLTASREDVQQFLENTDEELSQFSYFRALQVRAGFSSYVIFTDVLTGSRTVDEVADEAGLERHWLGLTYALLLEFSDSVGEAGWPIIEANLRGYEALWNEGVIDKLVAGGASQISTELQLDIM